MFIKLRDNLFGKLCDLSINDAIESNKQDNYIESRLYDCSIHNEKIRNTKNNKTLYDIFIERYRELNTEDYILMGWTLSNKLLLEYKKTCEAKEKISWLEQYIIDLMIRSQSIRLSPNQNERYISFKMEELYREMIVRHLLNLDD